MSQQTRALFIALLGPAIQALGLLWVLVNAGLLHSGREFTSAT